MTALPTKDKQVLVRVASDELERWKATAEAEGMPLSMWIRRQCSRVAVDAETIRVVDEKTKARSRKAGR